MSQNIIFPQGPIVDTRTGFLSLEWFMWLQNPQFLSIILGTPIDVVNGGTGLSSGTSGGILGFVASDTIASSVALTNHAIVLGAGAGATPTPLASLGTTTTVLHGNAAGAPTFGAVSLTADVSGILPGANGGTGVANTGKTITLGGNLTTTPANAITFTTTGATNVTLPTSGTLSTTTGTVTSVASNFTGGLISVAGSPITTSGTLAFTVAGTSGGIPYFSGATTWATSAALASNAIVIGGGAGAAPSTTTTGTGVLTALGTNVGSAGAFVTNGGALGSPSSAGTMPAFTLGAAITGDVVLATSAVLIRRNTADASDNGSITIAGGGDAINNRGAYMQAFGNESAGTGRFNFVSGNVAGGDILFQPGGTEAFRSIQTTQATLLGTTTDGGGIATGIARCTIDANGLNNGLFSINAGGAATYPYVAWNKATSGDNGFINFGTEGTFTSRGTITYNRAGGLVAYNTTSDERAKTVNGLFENSGKAIDAVPVYLGRMNWGSMDMPTMKAHEIQAVAPYSVTGERWAVDDKGDPVYQQASYSTLVPLMWAEIQSLRKRVKQLEGT